MNKKHEKAAAWIKTLLKRLDGEVLDDRVAAIRYQARHGDGFTGYEERLAREGREALKELANET